MDRSVSTDWHPADVMAALWKRGITMKSLSLDHGYHRSAVGIALREPWPAVERIIAAALDVAPAVIWPSRYRPDGRPKRERRGWDPSRKSAPANVRNEEAA